MSNQSTEGLRKAARRVFWEASNIEDRLDETEEMILKRWYDIIGESREAGRYHLKPADGIGGTTGDAFSKAGNKQEWEEAYNAGADNAATFIRLCLFAQMLHLRRKRR
jgi:hypothetical protein